MSVSEVQFVAEDGSGARVSDRSRREVEVYRSTRPGWLVLVVRDRGHVEAAVHLSADAWAALRTVEPIPVPPSTA